MARSTESTITGVASLATEIRRHASVHVFMIPYPAQPHIVPMLHLARQLVQCGGGITVTLVSFHALIDRLLKEESKGESSRDGIRLLGVPDDLPGFNPPSDLPRNPIVFIESLQLGHNLCPLVEKILEDRQNSGLQGPTCMVADFLHWWTSDVASKLNIPRYVLSANPACFILTILSFADNDISEYKEGEGTCMRTRIEIPGLPPLYYKNLPLFATSRKGSLNARTVLRLWPRSLKESAGVLISTCLELESEVIDTLRVKLPHIPVLPIGPLSPAVLNVSMEGLQLSNEAWVMRWLDQQPPLSVLYVCFGTTGMFQLTKRHVHKLARGLEASHERFLWVLRAPPDVEDVNELLPLGFEERVKGRGIFVRGWAPQLQILAHPSTGAFLSSCGWNSTVESLARGVPIIGWPSFADQPIICGYMEAKTRVAMEFPQQVNYFVEPEDIEKVVRVVLRTEEGRSMRERARKCKTIIAAALADGGSSFRNVQQFCNLIQSTTPPK